MTLIKYYSLFQSTLPMRGGTQRRNLPGLWSYFNPPSPCGEGLAFIPHRFLPFQISIHPPHAGRDAEKEA